MHCRAACRPRAAAWRSARRRLHARGASAWQRSRVSAARARVAVDERAPALALAEDAARLVGPAVLLLLLRHDCCRSRAPATPVCTPGGCRSARRTRVAGLRAHAISTRRISTRCVIGFKGECAGREHTSAEFTSSSSSSVVGASSLPGKPARAVLLQDVARPPATTGCGLPCDSWRAGARRGTRQPLSVGC